MLLPTLNFPKCCEIKAMVLSLVVFLLGSFVNVSQSEAQAVQSAAAGTMVVAAMETSGYHAQEQILQQLDQNLSTVAALVFLGVILSALFTASMLGNYQPALWMLVGAPVFFFTSGISAGSYNNRVSAAGTEWRFGAFEDSEKLKDSMEGVDATPASVSFVFHHYNRLISEIYQKLISVLTKDDLKDQMLFMARQRTLEDLFGNTLNDAGVGALAAYFMVECATEIGDARIIANANRDKEFPPEQKAAATKRYCDRFQRPDKMLSLGPWMDFVHTLPGATDNFIVNSSTYKQDKLQSAQPVSCAQMWKWVHDGYRIEAGRMLDEAAKSNISYYAHKLLGGQIVGQVFGAVKDFVTKQQSLLSRDTGSDPCPVEQGGQNNINLGAVDVLENVVAGMLLRKSISSTPSSAIFRSAFDGHHGVVPLEGAAKELSLDPRSHRSNDHKQKEEQFAQARKFEAYTLIHLLPYLQGFLLYGLSLTYPFFCLLIILPGQAGGFLTWMALWAWAKSWDVGWAMVMIADGIAWELLPKSAYFNPSAQAMVSPVNLLESAYGADPAYSLSAYWLLLSMMISAVPIVSAHAILGAKKAIASKLHGEVSGFAEKFSGYAEDFIGSKQVGQQTQIAAQRRFEAQQARTDANYKTDQKARKYLNNFTGNSPLGHLLANMFGTQSARAALDAMPPPVRNGAEQLAQWFGQATGLSSGDASGGSGGAGGEAGGAEGSAPGQVAADAPGGSNQETLNDRKAQVDTIAEAWRGNLGGSNPLAARLLYGSDTAGARDQQADNLAAIVFGNLGIDPDEIKQWTSDPELNQALTDEFNGSLLRNAIGSSEAFGAADMMMISSMYLGGFEALGGPNAWGAFRSAGGYVGRQRELGYQITRDETEFRANLLGIAGSQVGYEAYYDPLVLAASSHEAYLSGESKGGGGVLDLGNGRGGEFFQVGQYDPNIGFRLQSLGDSARMSWDLNTHEAYGNRGRWAFQVLSSVFAPVNFKVEGDNGEKPK